MNWCNFLVHPLIYLPNIFCTPMNTKSAILALNTVFLLFVSIFLLTSSSSDSLKNIGQPGVSANNANARVNQSIVQVPLPNAMVFASELVPLHDRDVQERLDRELTSITHRHSHTIRILKLAQRYRGTIERILAEQGVPLDFFFLSVAESGLENVVSPAGARGFWQLMSSTAKEYGLEVGNDVDERYHVEKATIAACRYLKKAHQRFGTWTMAAASYNRGMSGISKQISKQMTDNYYDLYLNTETARYIYRILAYKQLMSYPEKYGFFFNRKDLYPNVATKTVMVTSISSIPTFAKGHGTTYKTIKQLNPWMREPYLSAKAGKSYSVVLPL